jgi:hypothetical protein
VASGWAADNRSSGQLDVSGVLGLPNHSFLLGSADAEKMVNKSRLLQ